MRRLVAGCLLATGVLLLGGVREAAAGKTVTVFAAASLTESLNQAKQSFERSHPGAEIRLNMAASSRCRLQIEQGAPADVFLSANTENMDPLVKAGLVGKPVIFAHNRVLIITPKSNPGKISSPADLAKPGLKLVTCSPEVPIGKYTRIVIDKMNDSGDYGASYRAKVLANIASEEPNVKGIVAKVHLGEADAGVCYASDVTSALRKNLKIVNIPDEVSVIADYPIAVVKGSRQKALAGEFMDYILSRQGQAILEENGFLPVTPPKPGK